MLAINVSDTVVPQQHGRAYYLSLMYLSYTHNVSDTLKLCLQNLNLPKKRCRGGRTHALSLVGARTPEPARTGGAVVHGLPGWTLPALPNPMQAQTEPGWQISASVGVRHHYPACTDLHANILLLTSPASPSSANMTTCQFFDRLRIKALDL